MVDSDLGTDSVTKGMLYSNTFMFVITYNLCFGFQNPDYFDDILSQSAFGLLPFFVSFFLFRMYCARNGTMFLLSEDVKAKADRIQKFICKEKNEISIFQMI